MAEAGGNPLVSVGRVRGSQGRRGEVAVELKTDFPERFAAGAKFLLAKDESAGDGREYTLKDAWPHKGKVILKFAGVDTISDAEALTGLEVMIPSSQRKQLPAGSYYLGDLIGCRVIEGELEVGQITDWEDTGGGILLHVERKSSVGAAEEVLIPFAQEICTEIDIAKRAVRVSLPEGLLELNSTKSVGSAGKQRRN